MEKIIRYTIIVILMGAVVYSMIKLPKSIEKTTITKNKQHSTDVQVSELERSYILKEHTAYGVKVGFTKDQIYELLPREDVKIIDLFLEGMPTPAIEISIDSKPSLIAELVNEKVYQIRVLDSRFRTQEGIHIGSTLKELEQAYEEIIYGSGEGSVFAIVRSIQMSFELNCANQIPLEWYKSHDRNLLDDNAKITKILVR